MLWFDLFLISVHELNKRNKQKPYLIPRIHSSHMTDECWTMQEQAYQMKEAWKNMTQAECLLLSEIRMWTTTTKEQNELHEIMILIWTNLNNWNPWIILRWVNVSICLSCINLPQKRLSSDFAPISTVILETWLGKSRLHKLRVLFDSGSSGSIIVAKFVLKKLRSKMTQKQSGWQKEEPFIPPANARQTLH
jgi:hypothetical protein